jgi:ABC-type dipeptide/oligopeptide/nickel transport system ATPase component
MNKGNSKNEVANIYKKIPKHLLPQYHNPNFENHKIKIPFRMTIVGSSGSGKTNVAVEILKRMNDTFGKITVVTKNADEPIYNFLKLKIHPDQLEVLEGIENIPDLDTYDPDFQHLIIFDDLVLEKNQKKIEEYFIRGRKIAKGLSMMYLTQSYYKTPKTIRLNSNYLILKKLSSKRDLNLILSEVNIGIKKEELFKLYKYCIDENFTDFMLIDCDAPPESKFRKNFHEILSVEE